MPGGQQITVGQGSISAGDNRTVALSGQQFSTGQGSVLWHPNEADALHGQAITSGQGTLAFRSQHGQQINSFQGSVGTNNPQAPLVGFSISCATGTVIAEGQGVTVHITGTEIVISDGSVGIGPAFLTGSVATSAAGSFGNSREIGPLQTEVIGDGPIPISVGQGFISPNIEADDTRIISFSGGPTCSASVLLTGTAVTCGQGTFSTDGRDLLGIEVSVGQGTLTPVFSQALNGSAVTLAQSNVGAPGGASLSGIEVSVGTGTLARSPQLSGQAITSATGTIIGLPGVVSIDGIAISVRQGRFGGVTSWTEETDPTTTWTKESDPTSVWTKRSDTNTSWTKRE